MADGGCIGGGRRQRRGAPPTSSMATPAPHAACSAKLGATTKKSRASLAPSLGCSRRPDEFALMGLRTPMPSERTWERGKSLSLSRMPSNGKYAGSALILTMACGLGQLGFLRRLGRLWDRTHLLTMLRRAIPRGNHVRTLGAWSSRRRDCATWRLRLNFDVSLTPLSCCLVLCPSPLGLVCIAIGFGRQLAAIVGVLVVRECVRRCVPVHSYSSDLVGVCVSALGQRGSRLS